MTINLVEKYNPEWPRWFEIIKSYPGDKVQQTCVRIEHAGSTSIPGMTSKPIIDLNLVIEPYRFVEIKYLLEARGYFHEGDKGIKDRESFALNNEAARKLLPNHYLYVCPEHSEALRRHTAFREYLKTHPADEYVWAT